MTCIEADVFSGRENPRWRLVGAPEAKLRALLAELHLSGETPPSLPGLGYRGFILSGDEGSRRAFRGFIITGDKTLGDPTRTIERFLLDQAPDRLEFLQRVLRQELGPASEGM